MKKALFFLAILFLVVGVSGFLALRLLNFWPEPVMPGTTKCKPNAPGIPTSKTSLRVLSWNIQYSASRNYHFFYDGGKEVLATKSDVEKTIAQIIAAIKEFDPDIVMLQEVDADSDRSARVNQIERLWAALPYTCRAETPYFQSRYVPTPGMFSGAMGRVDTRLVVFSKYKINKATRIALPMLKESFLRQAFNLKRAVLVTEVAMEGGKTFTVNNTHFSAFSHGDGTMKKQVAKLTSILNDQKGSQWITAGDLNLLPPGDSPKRLNQDRSFYAPTNNPILPMFRAFTSALSPSAYKKNPDIYNTYIPYGKKKTDRWIDYLFISKGLHVTKYQVSQKHNHISDHLPIVVDLHLGPKPPANAPTQEPAKKPKKLKKLKKSKRSKKKKKSKKRK